MDYTSYEVQDWFRLEEQLLAQYQKREEETEQLRQQRDAFKRRRVHLSK